ncbi:MAG TPA: glycoside hydrolase family 44 protein [Azospirillaceae bacterium]|nr:glycoside hydrolase family 44 protein [Azospirillaceae bacterium]
MSDRDSKVGRRGLMGAGAATVALMAPGVALAARKPPTTSPTTGAVAVTINTADAPRPISPLIYGTNEFGGSSVATDKAAGIAARRLGGNRLTGYNWQTNHSHAGKDYYHQNDDYLPWNLGVPQAEYRTPGSVVSKFHTDSRAMGAETLVTVPLAGYVAADNAGPVSQAQTAPSARWRPIALQASADASAVRIDEFVRLMVQRHGASGSGNGIRAYALDNEPGLWFDSHPYLHPAKATYAELIEKGIATARMIKSIDPGALIYGPVPFGFSEMWNLQEAPDRAAYAQYGNFLGAYLAAFKAEQDRTGVRLLDVLDVHWYPECNAGQIPFSNTAGLQNDRLQAPRSLWDGRFVENSWIGQWYGPNQTFDLRLPLLPSLQRIVDKWYPGTKLGITEFNYGASSIVASGLAVADVLGAFGRFGVHAGYHWGLPDGFVGSAYRLYRNYDGAGGRFGDTSVGASAADPAKLSVWAATSAATGRLHVVMVNKTTAAVSVSATVGGGRTFRTLDGFTFDASSAAIRKPSAATTVSANAFTRSLPALSAWHFVLA